MESIELKYGKSHFFFNFDHARFTVLRPPNERPPLSDIEIGQRFDSPIGSPVLEDIVKAGEKVLIVVPDATREVGCGQIVNLLVRRLIANGTEPYDISAIFATGIHRPVTDDEKKAILTPFIFQRIRTIDHRPRELTGLERVGETRSGIKVELNRALFEHDHVILVGGISFHYFAGFTGGRKLVCPGLASSRTISATHKLAFDCTIKARRAGVGTAMLDGNAVHEAFMEATRLVDPSFAINSIVNSSGEITDIICGHWIASHLEACREFDVRNLAAIQSKRDLVVASCGGSPHDINLIQAHKAIEAASMACRDGGTIIVLAECGDGLGRNDFLNWFDSRTSREMADRLCESYQVNGQTAWSLREKTERFDIRIVTGISKQIIERMGMKYFESLAAALVDIPDTDKGFIFPEGARLRVECED
ncbi:MAG TPA: nickel-dependent lactate racemase [Pyrinomonadaceae bacterium]|nr:nickel-dependent lactate racemase [Pyrinomonadaceae bacterium]